MIKGVSDRVDSAFVADAFIVIELLVVIAIIAMFVGLEVIGEF